jgi:diguanylate cyclase
MPGEVETALRGPQAYELARKALEAMQRRNVWPTPLNFELWVNYVGDPQAPLSREIDRMFSNGEPFTEAAAEELAAHFLPKARLNDQIRDAGDQLSRELASVARAMSSAQKSSESYGQTLADVTRELSAESQAPDVRQMVDTLAAATRHIQRENRVLEQQLQDSTAEVGRLREHLEQVRRDATTDALTSLANRKAFDEELERACAEAEATGQPLTLAVIDIDHFKHFNDTWGHQTGDQVIRYVASVIGRMAPPPRFAARYGGEEFGLIFPGENGVVVHHTLEEIREEVGSRTLKRRSTAEELGCVSVSAGYAELRKGESAERLMERADAALYTSKRAGRNRTTAAIHEAGATEAA